MAHELKNEAEVYFALYGPDLDPDRVTTAIGLSPTLVRHKGEPMPRESSWIVSSGKTESSYVDIYDLSEDLISRLVPYAEEIVAVKEKLRLEAVLQIVLTIVANESVSTPAIGFEPSTIAFLARVGASIDVDTYLNAH